MLDVPSASDRGLRVFRPAPVLAEEPGLLVLALGVDDSPPEVVDRVPMVPGYEIISRLGVGASSEVWLADEADTGRIVAIKILHRHGHTETSGEFFRREIRMLAKLVHPHLALLYTTITTADGRQGLVMEWVDGWHLDEWLRMRPDLDLQSKMELFRSIVSGVALLHDHAVIHRDLKPANLIVNAEGTVKIVDFGLARLHQDECVTGMDGGSIGVSGTLHFMAPEQAANGPGARAMPVDVYALGLIFHRILTGGWLNPTDLTSSETLALVLNPAPLVFHGPAKSLPRDLRAILHKALAPDPARRYRHARELEADLERFAAKQPVAARKQTAFYLIATLLRRQARRSMVAAGLMLAGLAAGGAIYQRHRQVAQRNEDNLRHAYKLTSFTLGQLRNELGNASPAETKAQKGAHAEFPKEGEASDLRLPLDSAGHLDLRFYEARLADLRSASSESQNRIITALYSIQRALDLYCQLSKEAPDDPGRLLDAASARISFARLLDKTGRVETAGDQAVKALKQLDRLDSWQGFTSSSLPSLHIDALRLVAKDAQRAGDTSRAVKLAGEMVIFSESLPSGLLVRPENEEAPRLALAASDLASYAISADPAQLPAVEREIDRITAVCRAAHHGEPEIPALARGLGHCVLAKARLGLHSGRGKELLPVFNEAAGILIGDDSRIRLSSFPLVRELAITATDWAGAVVEDTDTSIPSAAVDIAQRSIHHLRINGSGTEEIIVLRSSLYLLESRLACRLDEGSKAANLNSRAFRMLSSRQTQDAENLTLALLTARALHQARSLKGHTHSIWDDENHAPFLDRLLKQLTGRSAELSPEHQRDLAALRQPAKP
jgi:tRNA A-37 threonylcarbamoyl transferase component Bud32